MKYINDVLKLILILAFISVGTGNLYAQTLSRLESLVHSKAYKSFDKSWYEGLFGYHTSLEETEITSVKEKDGVITFNGQFTIRKYQGKKRHKGRAYKVYFRGKGKKLLDEFRLKILQKYDIEWKCIFRTGKCCFGCY